MKTYFFKDDPLMARGHEKRMSIITWEGSADQTTRRQQLSGRLESDSGMAAGVKEYEETEDSWCTIV